jgi:hypothetical protein
MGAGLFTTLDASFLFSLRSADDTILAQHPLLAIIAFVPITVVAATVISMIVWKWLSRKSRSLAQDSDPESGPYSNTSDTFFLQRCALAWALLAPIFLLPLDSPWFFILITAAALTLAVSLRKLATPAALVTSEIPSPADMLFSNAFPRKSSYIYAILSAACFELTFVALVNHQSLLAALCLGTAVFTPAWRWLPVSLRHSSPQEKSRATIQVTFASILVILILWTSWVAAHHTGGGVAGGGDANKAKPPKVQNVSADTGYKGIILWLTPKEKKQLLPPAPRTLLAGATDTRKTLVIPFDGAYWYFQPPHNSPGVHPHVTHGDPTLTNIRSTNMFPLIMEAHQSLNSSIDLTCCRELQLTLANNDNRPGGVVLGVILTDSTLPGKPSQPLGGQVVQSTQPTSFTVKATPTDETLHYNIPQHPMIRKFDQITVVFFPAPMRSDLDVKMALKQFTLQPR